LAPVRSSVTNSKVKKMKITDRSTDPEKSARHRTAAIRDQPIKATERILIRKLRSTSVSNKEGEKK